VQRTESGERVGQIPDAHGVLRASTLFSWIPGRRNFKISEEQAQNLGRVSAALHLSSRTVTTPSENAIKSWDSRRMCGIPHDAKGPEGSGHRWVDGLQGYAPEAVGIIQKVCLRLQPIVAKLDSRETGLINADVSLYNVLWRKGRAGVFDFNDTGTGPYAICRARTVARFRTYERGQALVEAILNGHREVAPLSDAYVKFGALFELSADSMRLSNRAAGAVRRGTPSEEPVLRVANTLGTRLERLDL
jgi:Ser/Thr protein kinase RdoA (MazF antagonist)